MASDVTIEKDSGSTETPAGPARPGPLLAVARGSGRLIHRLARFLWLGGVVLLAAVVAIYLLLLGTEVQAPGWLRQQVEARATAVLEGGDLRFGAMTLRIDPDLRPHVVLSDAVLRDAEGTVLARVPGIGLQFSPRGLILRRELLVQEIVLTGAQIDLRREADGRVALSFGGAEGGAEEGLAPEAAIPDAPVSGAEAPAAGGLLALLDQFDSLFERPTLAALNDVRIEGLVVNYSDVRAGRGWTVDGGTLALELRRDVTRLTGDVSLLSGRPFVTQVTLDYESRRASPEARIALTVTDAAARDIASQSPALSWLAVLDAPISAAFRGEIGADGQPGMFTAALKIAEGALAPAAGAQPVAFDRAVAYLSYDPAAELLRFDQVELQSDWGALRAEGTAYLQDFGDDGRPAALLGQFALAGITLNPGGLYPEALVLPEAWVDFRLRLDPFRLTLGQVALAEDPAQGAGRVLASGEVSAAPEGWSVALDLGIERLTLARLMQIWPKGFRPGLRLWFAENLFAGSFENLALAYRQAPGQAVDFAMTQEFAGLTVRALRQQEPITGARGHAALIGHVFSLTLAEGVMEPPEGGAVDLAGSSFTIPDTRNREPDAEIRVETAGSITGALSILDQPPFGYLSTAGLPVDLAEGQARVSAVIRLPLAPNPPPGAIDWQGRAVLSDLQSGVLVPGRVLSAARLDLTAGPGALEIAGPARVGAVPVTGTWRLPLGPDAGGGSSVEARVDLSEAFLREFGIGLPPGMVTGTGSGQIRLDLPPGAPARLRLTSDLGGLRMALPALGWTKPPGTTGRFELVAALGAVPVIERITLEAAGLRAEGDIRLNAAGGLDRARFERVRLGGWFDAPVTLVGRGAERPVGVVVGGGQLDLTRATFGGGEGGGGAAGPEAPLEVTLDRLQVTEGIALTGFRGTFDTSRGLTGDFSARMNGGAAVQGRVVPQANRTALRLTGADAGAVLRDAGLISNATGGALDLVLLPSGPAGQFDGDLLITDLRVRDAPALASLLNAISVIGLLQQMAGQGLVFDEVRAEFRITPDRITILSSSAVGPGLGISLDGFYMPATNEVDFQGVVSPFYLVNSVGSVLTRRGEGLIGFNFNLRGPVSNPRVLVNPLSALTPGMFREIFRRPAPGFEE